MLVHSQLDASLTEGAAVDGGTVLMHSSYLCLFIISLTGVPAVLKTCCGHIVIRNVTLSFSCNNEAGCCEIMLAIFAMNRNVDSDHLIIACFNL